MRMQTNLLTSTAMIPIMAATRHFMKASAPPNPGSDGNNGGGGGDGNNGTATPSPTSQNNASETPPEVASFWSDPSPSSTPAPTGSPESAGGGNGGGGGSQTQQPSDAFAQALAGIKFGELFTEDAVKKMNEGDPSALHSNLQNIGQTAVREAVTMSARIISTAMQTLRNEFQGMIGQHQSKQDDSGALAEAFPSYSKPEVRPVIDRIHEQSKKHFPTDRAKAIDLTRTMLKIHNESLAPDLGLNRPPNGSGDFQGPATNWEEELLGSQ